jgi:hypothetical protein
MRRYELMMFPRAFGKVAFLGGHFETLAAALEEAGKHPDYDYEVRDDHHDRALVAASSRL